VKNKQNLQIPKDKVLIGRKVIRTKFEISFV